MNSNLTAVVLAGGAGKRFWPFSSDKTLFPFFGKPFIEYSVNMLLPKQVSRVVFVTNSTNHTAFSRMKFSVPSVCMMQKTAHGMADALLTAAPEIQNSALLILNGDDLTDRGLFSTICEKAIKEKAFGVIPAIHTSRYQPFGYLKTDGETVTDIIEKPGEGNEPSKYISILGHYIADGNLLLSEIRQVHTDQDDVYEKALSVLMKRYTFLFHEYKGNFASLKYPWNTLDAMDILLSSLPAHRGNNVDIKSNVVIEGNVYIDDNVRIFENTKIVGPCYIGKSSIIGNNNIIRNSHIGTGCVTGFNTDITRSYIGNHCWFHSNYIGDSALEENVSLGSGAVCANLRLDDGHIHSHVSETRMPTGKNKLGALIGGNVRIGVNTSIMPGVKIGKNSFIGSGIVVERDIPEDCYCSGKYTLSITRNRENTAGKNRDEFKKQL
jgi:NDP-sugar pyrophosphorylase family protein